MTDLKPFDTRPPTPPLPSPNATPTPIIKADPDSFWEELQQEAESSSSSSRSNTPTTRIKKELTEESNGIRRNSQSMSRDNVKDEEDIDVKLESSGLPGGGRIREGKEGRGRNGAGGKKEKEIFKPPLIDDLPIAWDEAHETFEVLEKCVYEFKKLGLSREQDEMMVCDCVFDRRHPDAEQCGLQSDCVNRAIFIECLAHECRAKDQCRNQRFTKREFGDLEIVSTQLKGYGLRAGSDIPAGTLIYEYIGEVVGEQTFRKRMAQYADEGIKHFYFMMLQKEEYIDATKKGGIGRFANHSCNPNCEVQKWVVGRRLRMGIFSKRDIQRGEEITFNYNVDRYGHEAQICHCGEPNCVGYIGGKTQTDIGGMNDLFLDALGIMDQVLAEGMKGNKKKKARHLDEDFIPILTPISEPDVQKVAAAIRQCMDNVRIMSYLLQRIKMTDDHLVHRQLMRMHGFSLMYMILTEMPEEKEIILLVLQSMVQWKLQIKNKILDSNIQEPVSQLKVNGSSEMQDLSTQLLEYWSTLEESYKIPRVKKIESLDAEDDANTHTLAEAKTYSYPHRRPTAWENTQTINMVIAPVKYRPPVFSKPAPPPPVPAAKTAPIFNDRSKLDAIIALAQQNVAAAQAVGETDSPAHSQADSSKSSVKKEDDEDGSRKRHKFKHNGDQNGGSGYGYLNGSELDKEAKKEKALTRLIAEVVLKSMAKYKEMLEHDQFKRHAKDCTHVLVEKEKRSSAYTSSKPLSLTEEKKAKIKAFTKEYIHKVFKKMKERGKLKRLSSSTSILTKSVNNGDTPNRSSPVEHLGTPSTSTPIGVGGGEVDTPTKSDGMMNVDELYDDMDMGMDMDMEVDQGGAGANGNDPKISPVDRWSGPMNGNQRSSNTPDQTPRST